MLNKKLNFNKIGTESKNGKSNKRFYRDHSHKKQKGSGESGLHPILFVAELEFHKTPVAKLPRKH